MKRNLDLMRDILLFVENSDKPLLLESDMASLCPSQSELAYNVYLLVDAGFLDAEKILRLGSIVEPLPSYRIYHLTSLGLTSLGCDYLDSVRSQSVWEQTKNKLKESGTGATLQVISEIASGIILSLVESHLPR